MMIPPSWFELTQRVMDRWRPGWRERAAKRKSVWDFVEFALGFALMPLFWYLLFQLAWRLHVCVYPIHDGYENLFWREGISTSAFLSSFLMLIPLFWPALIAAFLISNIVMWLIRPARRVMEREAAGDPEMTFRGANRGLIKWGGIGSVICLLLSLIGIVTLHSLH